MSDHAIKNAVSEKREIQLRIEKYERAIKRAKLQLIEIDKFISQWEKFSGQSAANISAVVSLKDKEHSARNLANPHELAKIINPAKEDVAKAALDIIQAAGQSVTRSDLFSKLKLQGIEIKGHNPEMILSTMLWRMRDLSGIVRLKSGGYCLLQDANSDDVDNLDDSDLEDVDAQSKI
jgi:hypothetical protein